MDGVPRDSLVLTHSFPTRRSSDLTQLGGVVGQLAATGVGRAVRAGFLFQLALGVQRTRRALERQVGAFATGELAGGTDITSHLFSAPQTRRFFGGRHPLCGIGVTSMMLVIL